MSSTPNSPSKRFGITHLALGDHPFVELEQAEYKEIQNAIHTILLVLDIEAVFDVLVENFIEFEKEIMSVSVAHMILRPHTPTTLHKYSVIFSRRLSNLLSAARAYLDQVSQRVGDINGADRKKACRHFKTLTNTEYDARFGYRFMEALRNHAQHGGLPVQGLTLETTRIDELLEFRLQIQISKQILVDDKLFRNSFREELTQRAESHFSLRPLARDYVAGLCAVHEHLRTSCATIVKAARGVLQSARAKFLETGSRELLGVCIVQEREDGTYAAFQGLSENMDDLLDEYTSKNTRFVNLEQRYVTSRDSA